jgi:organic hydroperoxide reductase OsmC/OhrA
VRRSPISLRWRGGALAFAAAHGDVVRVAPGEQVGEGARRWSPEELLAAGAASSFALALVEDTRAHDVPLIDATLKAACHGGGGTLERVRIEATLETLPGDEAAVRELAQAAVRRCAVAGALRVPVDVRLHVNAAEAKATRRALTTRV